MSTNIWVVGCSYWESFRDLWRQDRQSKCSKLYKTLNGPFSASFGSWANLLFVVVSLKTFQHFKFFHKHNQPARPTPKTHEEQFFHSFVLFQSVWCMCLLPLVFMLLQCWITTRPRLCSERSSAHRNPRATRKQTSYKETNLLPGKLTPIHFEQLWASRICSEPTLARRIWSI